LGSEPHQVSLAPHPVLEKILSRCLFAVDLRIEWRTICCTLISFSAERLSDAPREYPLARARRGIAALLSVTKTGIATL
jgi:hypothetical protein